MRSPRFGRGKVNVRFNIALVAIVIAAPLLGCSDDDGGGSSGPTEGRLDVAPLVDQVGEPTSDGCAASGMESLGGGDGYVLVMLRSTQGIDSGIVAWGDRDFDDVIAEGNPTAREGSNCFIAAQVDGAGEGEAEVALVKLNGQRLFLSAYANTEGSVSYVTIEAKTQVEACKEARDLGILPSPAGPCEP